MMIKLLISFLLFQLSLAQTSLQCKNPRSKICLLQGVILIGVEVPKFPDLAEKHSLIIRSGNIPEFTENFTSQFGGVTKVTLGRLNIESLHIPSNWVSLNAESNQIRKLIVESTDDDPSDGFVSDGPSDSNDFIEGPDKDNQSVETATDVFEANTTVTSIVTSTVKPIATTTVGSVLTSTAKPIATTTVETVLTSTVASVASTTVASVATTTAESEQSTEFDFKAITTTAEPDEVTSPLVGYKLEILNLANNKLQSIRELKCMVNLKELHLDGNELEFIEMATFDGMTKLRKLSLTKNKINHISNPQSMQLPSLEWFSLAFNRLATLQVGKWNMLQLVELDVSHNMLVKLDVDNFDQFVSLEKLAVANNSWTCYWLNEALKEISKRDFITLVDRDDDPGNCPNGLPVEGICCSLTVHDDEALNNENLQQRIQRFQKQQDHMGNDLKGKIDSFEHEWNGQWETLHRDLAEKRKRIEEREKQPKDDSKVTEKDINDLNVLIEDCKSLLLNMDSLRKQNALIGQTYTQSFYTTISLKNKLLAAMRNAAKLKTDLHQYEISFKADVK